MNLLMKARVLLINQTIVRDFLKSHISKLANFILQILQLLLILKCTEQQKSMRMHTMIKLIVEGLLHESRTIVKTTSK